MTPVSPQHKLSSSSSLTPQDIYFASQNHGVLRNKQSLNFQQKRKKRKNESDIGYPGVIVETGSDSCGRFKASIIKRESVKFEEDEEVEGGEPPELAKHNAIPLFQSQNQPGSFDEDTDGGPRDEDASGDEEGETSTLTRGTLLSPYNCMNVNNNKNRGSTYIHEAAAAAEEALVFANGRFSLKNLTGSEKSHQFYGSLDCHQPTALGLGGSLKRLSKHHQQQLESPTYEVDMVVDQPDPSFPPLPACAVLPASAGVVKMASFSGKSTCVQTPEAPESKQQVVPVDVHHHQVELSTSGSADSTSSGFVSASSGEQQLATTPSSGEAPQKPTSLIAAGAAAVVAERKAAAVTFTLGRQQQQQQQQQKQLMNASPKFLRKHKRYSSSSGVGGESDFRFSLARSSVYDDDSEYSVTRDLPLFKNPEYRDTSEDDEDDDGARVDDSNALQQRIDDVKKQQQQQQRRRPLKLFRSKISGRKLRKDVNGSLSTLHDVGGAVATGIDDIFNSPSYDDDDDRGPVVPQILGWEEIEYRPLAARDITPVGHRGGQVPRPPREFADGGQRLSGQRAYDDIDVKLDNSNAARSPTVASCDMRDVTFLTLRPRNRMRQRLPPKMRSGGQGGAVDKQQWPLTNLPKPVPTPSLPRDVKPR